MSVKDLDILIDEFAFDYQPEIVQRDTLSDFDRKYSRTDTSWLWKKWTFVVMIWIVNLCLISAVMFTKWGIYLIYPFITLPKIRDDIYIIVGLGAIIFKRYTAMWGEKKDENSLQNTDVTVACLVTSYTEQYSSVKDNIDSLLTVTKSNKGINISNLVICICDGPVIGKYNKTALSEMFLQDMSEPIQKIPRNYITWKGDLCKSELHYGTYGDGTKILLVKKHANHGKKDGLLLAKGIVNSINDGDIVLNGLELPIKYVYSTDADTVTQQGSLERGIELMEEYPELDAGVFILRVKFSDDMICKGFWGPFQDFQYFSSQYVRRNAESVFGKVTCLSGSGNICRVSSPSYHYANKRYGEYPRTTSIMDVAPKMIGTDRRYTTLKLKYSRDVKLVMFYDTFVYTETPQNLKTYISQRKRWGTNTFSNSLVNISSRNIPWFTKLSALVDILRLIASYFRFTSYIYFWGFLFIGDISIELIIFLAVTIGIVYLYTFICILAVGEKRWSLLYGFILNKIITPLITVRIFTEILLNFDDFKWGATQQVKGILEEEESEEMTVLDQHQPKIHYIQEQDIQLVIGDDTTDPYQHINNLNERDDGILYIGPSKDEIKDQLDKHGKTKSTTTVIQSFDSNDPIRIRKFRKNNKFLHLKTDVNRKSKQFEKKISKATKQTPQDEKNAIPTSLRQLDACGYDETEDDTSEVESRYTQDWKDKHFPDMSPIHVNPISQESGIPLPPPLPPLPPQIIMDKTGAIISTQKKIKKFHWKPLPPNMANKSFWRLSNTSLQPLNHENVKEVKDLFEIEKTSKSVKHSQQKTITLVSLKRANNAGIILKRLRKKFPSDEECLNVIMKSLIHLESKQISTDQIHNFMNFLQLDDNEIERLKSYDGHHKLVLVDKFFIKILVIPRINQRLSCELVKRSVMMKIDHVNKYCAIFQNICVELKEASKFKQFLVNVLQVGIIMNEDGIPTTGFKLESLDLLKHTNTNKSKSDNVHTLLDYVLKLIWTDNPDLLTFMSELPSLQKIGDATLENLKYMKTVIDKDLHFMKKEVQQAVTGIKKLKGPDHQMEKNIVNVFLKNYYKFYKDTKPISKKLKNTLQQTEEILKTTMGYYGEEYDALTPRDFFTMITNFIRDVKSNQIFIECTNEDSQ